MSVRVSNWRDLISGLVLVAIGVLGVQIAHGYQMGTAANMGPGYFPSLVCYGLTATGFIIFLRAFRAARPEQGQAAQERLAIRAPLLVAGALAAFALSLESLGIVIANILLVAIAGIAARGIRLRELAAIALAINLFTYLVFVKILGLTFPFWPE